jgi:hypothetical protein
MYTKFGINYSRYFDQGLIEIVGPIGFIRIFHYYAFLIESFGTGAIFHYALIIFGSIPFAFICSYFGIYFVFLLLLLLITSSFLLSPAFLLSTWWTTPKNMRR